MTNAMAVREDAKQVYAKHCLLRVSIHYSEEVGIAQDNIQCWEDEVGSERKQVNKNIL